MDMKAMKAVVSLSVTCPGSVEPISVSHNHEWKEGIVAMGRLSAKRCSVSLSLSQIRIYSLPSLICKLQVEYSKETETQKERERTR